MRLESHKIGRYACMVVLSACALACLSSAVYPAGTSETPKAYNPFDEARPKTPQEMLDDKRLDVKVKVFVKDKNLKQLLGELSEKTGVKLSAARELHSERAIIYFHSRPLRDVMTEISDLYGYHWLVSGKAGAYEYELFEDMKHSKLREQRKMEQKERENALLLDFIGKIADGKLDENVSKRLQEENPDREWPLADPVSRKHAQLLRSLGPDLLRRGLAGGRMTYPFKVLPPDAQKALYEREKASIERIQELSGESGAEEARLADVTSPASIADMMDAQVYVQRDGGGALGFPQIRLGVIYQDMSSDTNWPDSSISEKDYRSLVGWSVPPQVAGADGVPADPSITKKDLSWVNYQECLRMGDVLQAIAEQSGSDVIADYHFQDVSLDFMQAIEKRPLNEVTRLLCSKYDCSCQADKGTIRFRYNNWFVKEPPVEPPAELLTRCWAHLGEEGVLRFEDELDLARLPEIQRKWDGLKLMPNCREATSWLHREPLLLWSMFTGPQIATAESESGLSVAELPAQQQQSLIGWGRALHMEPFAPESLEGAAIHIKQGMGTRGGVEPVGVTSVQIRAGESVVYKRTLFPLQRMSADVRNRFAAQRKADMDAEIIELVQ